MRWLSKFALRLRSLLRRESVETELANELRFHLDRQIAQNMAAGMSREEARCAALREFGGVDQIREECSDMRKVNWLQDFVQDLRYGLRVLRKSPGFTAVAILTLALGIGANTAIFSIVYAVLLKPLPYPNPQQLVSVVMADPQEGIPANGTSYENFREWRAQNHVFAELAAFQFHQLTLTGYGEPLPVDTAVVTPGMFSVFGVKPIAGRTFIPEDGKQGSPPVVVLSEALWRDRFGSEPKIVGSNITLDKTAFTVIGVAPASFAYPPVSSTEHIWIPLQQDPVFGPWMDKHGGHWLRVVARMKSGVSTAQAQSEMDTIGARLTQKYPDVNAGWVIRLVPLQEMMVGNVKLALVVLLGCVGLVLLIACANVANLLVARATTRMKEMALRAALGAGRRRIVRQLLTESALLGLAGGLSGVLLAYWSIRALIPRLPSNLPQPNAIRVDFPVLVFAFSLSLLASLLFGLAPALFATGSDLHNGLKEGGRSSEGGGRRILRGALAVAEIALAMVLLVGAGLLVRSFLTLTSVNPGFDVQGLMTSEVDLPLFEYSKPEQWTAFNDELLRRLQDQPGMHDTAEAVPLPLANGFINLGFDIVGTPPLRPGSLRTGDFVSVSPNYFRVMGIPLLRGRWFTNQDRPESPRVTLISETLAQMHFPNQDPIGKQLSFGLPPSGEVRREIIGVVGDVRDVSLGQTAGAMMYVPLAQSPFWGTVIVVRSNLSAASIAGAIRQQVHAIDKDLPVTDVRSMADALSESVQQPRFRTLLLGLFGAMALVLAAAGIFGVISYSVSQRTHEIGIRVTLGATPTSVVRLVLEESVKLVLLGFAVGIPTALGLTRLLHSLLFEVSPADPGTFVAVAVMLGLVTLAASYVPTRRALQVDPMVALRHE